MSADDLCSPCGCALDVAGVKLCAVHARELLDAAVDEAIEGCARACDDLARKLDVERDETVVDHEGELEEACAETARDLATTIRRRKGARS